MKHLNTYKIFESKDSLDDKALKLEECFRDIEDLGLKVTVNSEKASFITDYNQIIVFMDKCLVDGDFDRQLKFSVGCILETVEFANSYCKELGLYLDGVNYTYYDPKEEESLGRYAKDMDEMIDWLSNAVPWTENNLEDMDIDDLLLCYKEIKE